MSDWPSKLQHTFVMEYFKLLAGYLPGDATLNQIRVLQYIGLHSLDDGSGTTHTDICQSLEMKPATVTRAVTRFLGAGLISETLSLEDERQRFIAMDLGFSRKGTLDKKVEALAKNYFRAS